MAWFENLFGSLFNYKRGSRDDLSNRSTINAQQNHGKIAGRDIIEAQPKPSWVERRKITREIVSHFKLFFSLADTIKEGKCVNDFRDCRNRMKREFDISHISVLDENHQKEIYDMYETLMNLERGVYTTDLRDTYLKRLTDISDSYV